MPAVLHRGAALVAGDPFHGQQRGAVALAEQPGLGRGRVPRRDALVGRRGPDARGAQQLVQTVLGQHRRAEADEPGRQEVAHQCDRLAVGEPDPFETEHQRLLRDVQCASDCRGGVPDLVPEHPGRWPPAFGRQVVVQAGQLQIPGDGPLGDQRPRAAPAYHQALADEIAERGTRRRPGYPEPLGQVYLVLQPGAGRQRSRLDGRLELQRDLEVQRDWAGPVDADRADRHSRLTAVSTAAAMSSSGGYSRLRPTTRP